MTHSNVVTAVGAREAGLGANLQTALKVFLEAVALAALNKSCCNLQLHAGFLLPRWCLFFPMHAPCKDTSVLHGCPPQTPGSVP